jgi:hypothetical protein
MRRLILPVLLGLGVLGATFALPGQAHASWLSEGLDNHPVQVNITPTPAYYQPTYAPQAYAPVQPYPSYYAPSYYPPVPVARPLPVYRPAAPVYGRPIERYPVRSEYRGGYEHRGYEHRGYDYHHEPYRRW